MASLMLARAAGDGVEFSIDQGRGKPVRHMLASSSEIYDLLEVVISSDETVMYVDCLLTRDGMYVRSKHSLGHPGTGRFFPYAVSSHRISPIRITVSRTAPSQDEQQSSIPAPHKRGRTTSH